MSRFSGAGAPKEPVEIHMRRPDDGGWAECGRRVLQPIDGTATFNIVDVTCRYCLNGVYALYERAASWCADRERRVRR